MRRRNKESWLPESGINLMPLLDVIFNLIFFFILATTIKESKAFLDVKLPKSTEAQAATAPQALVINVTEENQIFLQDEEVPLDTLNKSLEALKAEKNINRVIIRGDAKAYNQTIVSVLDACAKVGLLTVSIEVKPKPPE